MKKTIFTMVIVLFSQITAAQKMDSKSGDFKALKGQSTVNVEFNYSNLKLMKENLTESEYVANRIKELNEKNKGNGDIWKKKWENANEGIWEPKFLELMLSIMKKAKINTSYIQGDTSAKYTLLVDVVWIYPGWDVFMMKQPAKVSMEIKLVETANRSNVLAEIHTKEAPGDQWGNQFSNETRIGEGFAKTAKSLAKYIEKQVD
jgi:hypothetical protein